MYDKMENNQLGAKIKERKNPVHTFECQRLSHK